MTCVCIDQETLLGVFQTLQVNAKWWHTLSELGIQIDPRTLQSSDANARELAMKAVVPLLLERSGEDLGTRFAIGPKCRFLHFLNY